MMFIFKSQAHLLMLNLKSQKIHQYGNFIHLEFGYVHDKGNLKRFARSRAH